MHRTTTHVTAFAPASVANLGPGFDVLGVALAGPGDTVTVRRIDAREVRMDAVDGDGGALPLDTSRNIAGAVVRMLWEAARPDFGIAVTLVKGLPLGSGLGSSAASAAAGVKAAAALLGVPFAEQELLRYCGRGEALASGSVHYDNVAPAFLGGMVRVVDDIAPRVERVPVPAEWRLAVVHPDIVLPTSEMRALIPDAVRATAPRTLSSRVDALIAAIARSDMDAAGAAMLDDPVITPYRLTHIPHAREAWDAALAAGAAGVAIAGSGPTLCALTPSESHAKVVADAMRDAWHTRGISSQTLISPLNAAGAVIKEERQ